jgi:hypothetical protein
MMRPPALHLRALSEGGPVSVEELVASGWDCQRVAWSAGRTLCSAPNQGFPTTAAGQPSTDNRAAFAFRAFESGAFVGTLLQIRGDLYHGQPCSSTGEPYAFIESIGYFECFHPIGR